jgi:chromosome segregation ATPase
MFEDLVANMTFSPVLIVVCAAIAIASFFFGWAGKGSGAKGRELALKRDVLEAKRSIPQLESSVRNRELQIARLTEEVKGLTDGTTALQTRLEGKENELRSASREARNLTSELEVVKGNRTSTGNVIMDGFEDEASDSPADSKLAARLEKTEALYQKLKKGLIKRDEHIEELQAQLDTDPSSQAPASGELQDKVEELDASADELRETIRSQEGVIEKLRGELTEARQEKEMLADMAKRRSENNQALKEASAEAEAQLPQLEVQIADLGETITTREASIKRMLAELEELKSDKQAQEQQITAISSQLQGHQQVLDEHDAKVVGLESSIEQRDERISALTNELGSSRDEIAEATRTVQAREATIVDQQAKVDAATARISDEQQAAAAKVREHEQTFANAAKEHGQATTTLQGTIQDRDFKIGALNSEIDSSREDLRDLKVNMESLQQQSSQAKVDADQRQSELTLEMSGTHKRAEGLNREMEDLRSGIEQRERWLTKLKQSLAEREVANKELNGNVHVMQNQRQALEGELEGQHNARKTAEALIRDRDRQISTAAARSKLAAAELTEQNQSINVYKSVVEDREIKLATLSNELSKLSATTELENGAGEKTKTIDDVKSQSSAVPVTTDTRKVQLQRQRAPRRSRRNAATPSTQRSGPSRAPRKATVLKLQLRANHAKRSATQIHAITAGRRSRRRG